MAPPDPVPPRGDQDLGRLGRDLLQAVRADLRQRRRNRAGAAFAVGLGVTGLAGALVPGRSGPTASSTVPVPVDPAPAPSPLPVPTVPLPPTTTAPVPPTIGVVPDPASLLVLVDRLRFLPPGYEPAGLVEAPVPFIFSGPDPKRLLRPEAARALEGLFTAAAADGLPLAAVSGYRSEETQRNVFSAYAAREGEEVAARSTARPGHSEHQTGLAVDVTGADGACPASDCFGARPEAAWLAAHVHEYGFVVRYPRGKEAVTGYDYEPWHLRYVGIEVAGQMTRRGLTLDEHLGAAQPAR